MQKIALITGTGRGIGKALAELLLRENFKVFGYSRTNQIESKNFTFIKTEHANKGLLVHSDIFIKCKIDYLAGKKMGDLMEAEQNATLQTLINNIMNTYLRYRKRYFL